MDNNHFIDAFQRILLSKVHDKKHWAQELSSHLNLSTDAVYKKSRMQTSYSLDEFLLLIDKYGIRFEDIKGQSRQKGQIRFDSPMLNNKIADPMEYLLGVEKSLQMALDKSDSRIYYTTRELPVFYYFLNPYLTAFKLYVFSKIVWEIPRFKNSPFHMNLFDPDLFKFTKQMWDLYASLASDEFWTADILDNTLQQLSYLNQCGQINKEDAAQIINACHEILNKCSNMAECGSKMNAGTKNEFRLYENKILHTSNHILVKSAAKDFIFLTYDNPNYIYSDDKEFVQYSMDWYEKIKKNSYYLGEGTGHLRYQFFNLLKYKVEEAKKVSLL